MLVQPLVDGAGDDGDGRGDVLEIGLVGAVVLALLLGAPTLRLRADYLAIVTIAASEIFRFMMSAPSWRGVTGS